MIRVALLCDQLRLKGDLAALLQRDGLVVLGCIDRPDAIPEQLRAWAPDATVIAGPFAGTDPADLARRVQGLLPGAALLVLLRSNDSAQTRQLFLAGADDVLTGTAGLAGAIREAVQRRTAGAAPGYILAVWSPKGGVGCSSLAANLGVALQAHAHRRTLLVDLNGPFGGADRLLGLKPERTLADLSGVAQELNPSHVLQALTAHGSGLNVLCASRRPDPAGGLLPEHLSALLPVCRRMFDTVLLDVPAAWSLISKTAVDLASRILLVVTPDAPAIGALQDALPLLPPGKREQRLVGLVINRASPRVELQPREIGAVVDLPVLGTIRSDFLSIEPLVNSSEPLVSTTRAHRESRIGEDLLRLARIVA